MFLVSSQVATWPQLSPLQQRFESTLRPQRDRTGRDGTSGPHARGVKWIPFPSAFISALAGLNLPLMSVLDRTLVRNRAMSGLAPPPVHKPHYRGRGGFFKGRSTESGDKLEQRGRGRKTGGRLWAGDKDKCLSRTFMQADL